MTWEVESFGRDCLGNISGYRVVKRGPSAAYETAGVFCGDIYEPGSFEHAKKLADQLCERKNSHTKKGS